MKKVGALKLINLPKFETLSIAAGIREVTGWDNYINTQKLHTDPHVVVDSTALTKLESFLFTTLVSIHIIDNPYLESIVLPLENTTAPADWTQTSNIISGNGNSKTTLSLPDLWELNTPATEFSDLASIDIPRLRKIEGGLLIGNNDYLTSLDASKLQSITEGLTIEWNPRLKNASFPVLRNMDSLIIQGTPVLEEQDSLSFPALHTIRDAYIGGDDSPVDCQLWDNHRCTGIITSVYSCGSDWKHIRKVWIADDPAQCKYTHPRKGWNRARKLKVGLQILFFFATVTAAVWSGIHFRRTLKDAMAGTYSLVQDGGEDVEMEAGEGEGKYKDQERSRLKP